MSRRAPAVLLLALALCGAVALTVPVAAYEVGAEWINAFPDNDGCSQLHHCDECAEGFYNKFTDNGWTGRYCLGNGSAWEEHFKQAPDGGTDFNYVDTVDFAFIASHGSPCGVSFNSRHDDQRIKHSESRWGDNDDLEWIALDACSCLAQATHSNWRDPFKGLHTILGFDTTCHDKSGRGEKLAKKLFKGYSVVQAWWHAAEVTEGSATYAAAKGVRTPHDTYNDHIFGQGSVATDSDDPDLIWYYSHRCD